MRLISKVVEHTLYKPNRTGDRAMQPERFEPRFRIRERSCLGRRIMTVDTGDWAKHHIYMLHGGAYVSEACPFHRSAMKTLADRGFRVTYIDYPLAPEHTYSQAMPVVTEGWKMLCELYNGDTMHLLGDSAGGGMALSLLMQLRDSNGTMPDSTALSSPWLDVTMSDPEIDELQKTELLLSKTALVYTGKAFAGEIDPRDPRLSPLFGHFENLGRIFVFYSDSELFCPDCRSFVQKASACSGTTVYSHCEKGMFHDYLMFTVSGPARRAYDTLADFYEKRI